MIDGVIVRDLVTHTDERGFFREIIRVTDDFFAEGFGQWSHSHMYTGVIKAWHLHRIQVDWWYVTAGVLRVGLHDLREKSPTHGRTMDFLMGDQQTARLLKIPPGVAHGCKVGSRAPSDFCTSPLTSTIPKRTPHPHDDRVSALTGFRGLPSSESETRNTAARDRFDGAESTLVRRIKKKPSWLRAERVNIATNLLYALRDVKCRILRLDRPGGPFSSRSGVEAEVTDLEADVRDPATGKRVLDRATSCSILPPRQHIRRQCGPPAGFGHQRAAYGSIAG